MQHVSRRLVFMSSIESSPGFEMIVGTYPSRLKVKPLTGRLHNANCNNKSLHFHCFKTASQDLFPEGLANELICVSYLPPVRTVDQLCNVPYMAVECSELVDGGLGFCWHSSLFAIIQKLNKHCITQPRQNYTNSILSE